MTEDKPYRNTMQRRVDRATNEIQTRLSVVEAANASLAKALKDVLAHEQRRAKVHGYSDCACINFNRELERAYESGQCPHQLARKALDSTRVRLSAGARLLEAALVLADYRTITRVLYGDWRKFISAAKKFRGEKP